MDSLLDDLESVLANSENKLSSLKKKHQNFRSLENTLEYNLEAAKLNKGYAYSIATVYLSLGKLQKNLSKDDQVLKFTKKIQQRSKRIKEVEKDLTLRKTNSSKKSIDSKDLSSDKMLTKRSEF